MQLDLSELTMSTFAGHEGTLFRFEANGSAFALKMIRVYAQPGQFPGRRTPFSVLFSGPAERVFVQGIGRLSADGFGGADLFMTRIMPPSPIELDRPAGFYEVVFT